MNILDREYFWIILVGLVLGIGGVLLVLLGNPVDTGVCISCFLENIAGSLRLHDNARMAYIRPEIIGFVLGAFAVARVTGEFRVSGGSAGPVRFLLGFLMILGSAVFMGCPIKLVFRLAGGDFPAILALFGLVAGIWTGILYIRRGFALGRARSQSPANGYLIVGFTVMLFLFMIFTPAFLQISQKGAGSYRAPSLISLGFGLLLGLLAQRSRFCVTGSFVNLILAKDKSLLTGLGVFFLAALVMSLITGEFNVNIQGRVGTHTDYLWSFLGMYLVGLAAAFAGGCPFRQLIVAGEGNVDAGVTTLGMIFGAALVQNFNLASSVEGASFEGKIATIIGLITLLILGLKHRYVRE